MLRKDQVIDCLIDYAETEMLPAVIGVKKYAAFAALALLKMNAGKALEPLMGHSIVSRLGIADAHGLVDIDKAYRAAKQAFDKLGPLEFEVPFLDVEYTIKAKDIETIYRKLKALPAAQPPTPEPNTEDDAE
jgi:hypothetical protein